MKLRRRTPMTQSVEKETRLLIFDTHPIQYRSPVFSEIAKSVPDLLVVFFSESFDGRRWWFREYNKSPQLDFNLSLKSGFQNRSLQSGGPISFCRQVIALLGKHRPQAILIYGYYLWQHWVVIFLAKIYGIRVVFIGETFSIGRSGFRSTFKKMLLPILFRQVNSVVSIGNKNFDHYRSLGLKTNKITKAKYCIDGGFFQLSEAQAKAARKRVREKYQIPSDAFVALFVGRFFERKRPLDILEIHQALFLKHSHFFTLMVGTGELEASIRRLTSDLSRMIVAGALDQSSVRDTYYASDMLIVPSEFETWGLVVNEAMACGVPAVVTETCGVAGDLVVNGETGFVFPVGAIPKAVAHIEKVIENPKILKQLSSLCKKRVSEEFDVMQMSMAIVRAAKMI